MESIKNKGNAVVWFIVVIAIIWGFSFLFSGDRENDPYESNVDSFLTEDQEYSDEEYYTQETRYFNDYECTEDCSGHEAGYNWAEENGISDEDDCGGNSNSFIEGCYSYVEENY